jgi:hypothetical protein
MTSLFNLMQNINKLIEIKTKDTKLRSLLIGAPESYNMNENSLFLDIGSGFGKPVFHAALQVDCESKGIEVVPARVEYCLDFYFEFLNEKLFFEELEKKINEKNEEKSEKVIKNKKKNKNKKKIKPEQQKEEPLQFINVIKMNSLNPYYYESSLKPTTPSLYLELKINQYIIHEDCYIDLILSKEKIFKPVLVEDPDTNCLKYGSYFMTDEIDVLITAIDDHLYNSLVKVIISSIYTDPIENDILNSLSMCKGNIRNFYEIVEKIENKYMLEIISFVNTHFNGRKINTDIKYLNKEFDSKDNNNKKIENIKKVNLYKKDLYEELKLSLEKNQNLFSDNDISKFNPFLPLDNEELILKSVLVDLKSKYDPDWHKKTVFVQQDATKCNNFSNEKKEHFTHIYAYNKLMSKECRSRIAKILNKTKFKVLAWYSNPKQTKKSGLKNFTFLCKFPMQSTSTEKFHVYVYLKTK